MKYRIVETINGFIGQFQYHRYFYGAEPLEFFQDIPDTFSENVDVCKSKVMKYDRLRKGSMIEEFEL